MTSESDWKEKGKRPFHDRLARKHDAKGRSTSKLTRRSRRKIGPQDCLEPGEPWMWRSMELLESVSIRTLSLAALRALMRIEIEHISHGLQENGELIITHANFHDYGVAKDAVAPAIKELEHYGLIRVRRGRGGNGTAWANRYRLTWIGDRDGAPPTNEWKGILESHVDRWKKTKNELKPILSRERRRADFKKKPRPDTVDFNQPDKTDSSNPAGRSADKKSN